MAKKYNEVRIPFDKMSFTPDVPATALGANEYNSGRNVETDVRGIRSVAGDQEILDTIPSKPTFVTGGFRQNAFWFIVACENGRWYMSDGDTTWTDISPNGEAIPGGYDQTTNITEGWNGTVPFFNDAKTAPMFLPDVAGAILVQYSNQSPIDINNITAPTYNTRLITFDTQPSAPFDVGGYVTLTGVDPLYYDGSWLVTACSTTSVTIASEVASAYSSGGTVGPTYTWNYNPNWNDLYANFMRLYNTPNVGSILVAGNLTATDTAAAGGDTNNYPVTVRWSQAFGLNSAPTTWTPTVTNVANELEVPLRGPALDGFPCNGQFFLCSYWDTVVFSPINYATTSTPILGVRIFNQGRGLLSSNCWGNTDKMVYGVDARDIWAFDGSNFVGIGNQRVKNWFYDNLDPANYDRVFMEVNTQKNQVEIYFPDADATNGVPNKMLSYRYDLDVWNAPRDVSDATFACESPIWINPSDSSLPEWNPNLGSRTTVYARGVSNGRLIQKDQGFAWYDDTAITSEFIRDNIKLLPEYSGKLLVHRILPEVVNLGAYPDSSDDELPIDPAVSTHKGNITVTIGGANSVGSAPTEKTPVEMAVDTTDPWIQVNQNAFRVNRIEIANTSNNDIWMCSAATWQYTQTEDDH